MTRQTSPRSSSSRRENTSENLHAKRIGCMSGVFHFVYKYQNRRKFLTFGKKKEKNAVTASTKAEPSGLGEVGAELASSETVLRRRLSSCDVPRSPTLPAEIRQWSSKSYSTKNFPPTRPSPPQPESVSAADDHKRRKLLLGALEKCDQDLKALQNVIQAVQTARHPRTRSLSAFQDEIRIISGRKQCLSAEAVYRRDCVNKGKIINSVQQPSPVSLAMLDEFSTPSPLCIYSKQHTTRYGREHRQQRRKKPGEEDIINLYFFNRITTDQYSSPTKSEDKVTPLWSSKAMTESVDEVCRDIAWGESREVGRIGLALQDYICRDLIEEIVTEMACFFMYSLPFEACKRRLRF